jgi:hypothetical protein
MQTSYSDMQRFMSCPRSWYLGTYRRLRRKAEPPTGPLPFGGRIHTALELWEGDKGATPINIIWDTLMMYEYDEQRDRGGFLDGLDKENKLGLAMLEGYVEWANDETADWETLAVEAQLGDTITLEVDGVAVDILVRGKLDRRLRRLSDGAVFIGDYKTVGNFGEPTIMGLEMSPQGRLYMMLDAVAGKAWVAGVVYTLLRKVLRTAKANPPFYKRLVIPISPLDVAAYRYRMIGVLKNMILAKYELDSGMDHRIATPFQPSWQCATCPFKLPCAEYQSTGKEAAEQMLEDLYVAGDPFERYTDDKEAV